MAVDVFKQPGPSIILYYDLFADDTPALFLIQEVQTGENDYYVQVFNRRTSTLVYTTGIYNLALTPFPEQAALSEAKIFMAPYLKGLASL